MVGLWWMLVPDWEQFFMGSEFVLTFVKPPQIQKRVNARDGCHRNLVSDGAR